MIVIECDFCGARLEEIPIQDSWELQKHREAGRVACDDCEELYREYQEELFKLEEKNRNDFEEAKNALKEKFFKYEKTKIKSSSPVGATREDQGTTIEEKKKKKPRTFFRTLDS